MTESRTIRFVKSFFPHKKNEKIVVSESEALEWIQSGYADIEPEQEKLPEEKGFLPIRGYSFWEKYKDDKRFLIEGMLYPETVNMLYSPPAGFKTLLAQYLGMCVAASKPFLGLKTKRFPVLICDKENPKKDIKKRLMGIRKGLSLRSKSFPLYVLSGEGSLDELSWIELLKKTVQEYEIKLVIFDTLHRFSDYEENAADDLNRLYSDVFQPLTQNYDCAVLFLHHCTKEGNYRGTSDFLGQVDTAWSLRREGKTGKFVFVNEKNRSGELDKIPGEIEFGEDFIKFKAQLASEEKAEAIGKISMLKEVTNEIRKLFPMVGVSLTRSQIFDHFEMAKLDYSFATIRRSLNWLLLNDFLDKNKKGIYVRKQETVFDQSMSQPNEDNSQIERV